MPSPTEISPAQLIKLIGLPGAPHIVDVRVDEDFDPTAVIPTAIRFNHNEVESLGHSLRDQRVVVVCDKGLKLGQGAAALLRSAGVQAEFLYGGMTAWREDAHLTLDITKLSEQFSPKGTLWVTRHRPKIDRIACPWLIRRFVDRNARFMFVAPSQVELVAEKFNAIPFDIDGAFWGHRDQYCTFDTLIHELGLASDALKRLALIIRGADTGNLDLTPQSAGLMAASLGLSRMYRDDLAQLEAGMGLYDAFYRWCRDATDETHQWPH